MFERRKPSRIAPDLTPMIDVTFLLLVFFTVVSSMTTVAAMDCPNWSEDGAYVGPAPAPTAVEVYVDSQDDIYVEGNRVNSGEDLAVQIELAIAEPEHNRRLIVETDGRSLHSSTIRVLDAAKQIGVRDIQYRSEPRGRS